MQTQINLKLNIDGMTCDHCVKAVLAALRGAPGVRTVGVRVGEADIVTSSPAGAETAVRAIGAAGYKAEIVTDKSAKSPAAGCDVRCGCCAKEG